MLYYVNGCRKRKEEFDKELKNAVSNFVFGDGEPTKEDIRRFNHILNQCYEILERSETVQANHQMFEIKGIGKIFNCYINGKKMNKLEFDKILNEYIIEEVQKDSNDECTEEELILSINKLYCQCQKELFDGKEVLLLTHKPKKFFLMLKN